MHQKLKSLHKCLKNLNVDTKVLVVVEDVMIFTMLFSTVIFQVLQELATEQH